MISNSAPFQRLFPIYKEHVVIDLRVGVMVITGFPHFGAASASTRRKKEAAHSMTFILFDSTRHFPKCRSSFQNGILHRLS